MVRIAVLAAVIVALAAPATASAAFWSWGYNYVGQLVNPEVYSGYNYWQDQDLEKQNGDWVTHGWQHTDGTACTRAVTGQVSVFYYTSDLGCGGYLENEVLWSGGTRSYLYVDSAA